MFILRKRNGEYDLFTTVGDCSAYNQLEPKQTGYLQVHSKHWTCANMDIIPASLFAVNAKLNF